MIAYLVLEADNADTVSDGRPSHLDLWSFLDLPAPFFVTGRCLDTCLCMQEYCQTQSGTSLLMHEAHMSRDPLSCDDFSKFHKLLIVLDALTLDLISPYKGGHLLDATNKHRLMHTCPCIDIPTVPKLKLLIQATF